MKSTELTQKKTGKDKQKNKRRHGQWRTKSKMADLTQPDE